MPGYVRAKHRTVFDPGFTSAGDGDAGATALALKVLLEKQMIGLLMENIRPVVELGRFELLCDLSMFDAPHDRIAHQIFRSAHQGLGISPQVIKQSMNGDRGLLELGSDYIEVCADFAPAYGSDADAEHIMARMIAQWRMAVANLDEDANDRVEPRLQALNLHEFLALDIPPRGLVLAPWLPEKGLAMIYAPRGIGKTLLALSCAYAIASCAEFLGLKAPKPRKVLYLDGEMPARLMQERLAMISQGFDAAPPDPAYFRMLSADLTESGLPDLGSLEGQAKIDAAVGDAEVIVVDNISALVRTGRENEAEGWAVVQDWALSHRRAGRCIVFVHHAGKGGTQRGSSKREDVLDTVIALKRPADYRADQGARFEVHIEKGRSIHGLDAQPFEARYEVRDNAAIWTQAPIDDGEMELVIGALQDGKSIRKTAAELGLDRSKVERLKRRATERGMLNG